MSLPAGMDRLLMPADLTPVRRDVRSLADPAVWNVATARSGINYLDAWWLAHGEVRIAFRLALADAQAGANRVVPLVLLPTLSALGTPSAFYVPYGSALAGGVMMGQVNNLASGSRLDITCYGVTGTWPAGTTVTGTASWLTGSVPAVLPGTPV